MRRISREKNVPIKVAIDLVDNDLLKRALVAWAHWPHLATIKGGGGTTFQVPSGERTGFGNTSRRITDDFFAFAFTLEEEAVS
jgi:hypothetical protein